MDEKEFEEDVRRIMEEEAHGPPKKRHHFKIRGKTYNPWPLIGGLVLAVLIVMMAVPYYGVKLDPEPRDVPGREILPSSLKEMAEGGVRMPEGRANYAKLMIPEDPAIKLVASKIATTSCTSGKVCHAKAMYKYVQQNVEYVSDPPAGYLEHPFETLYTGGSDCDGMAILLANFLLSVGVNTRLAFIPGHVYVQVKIDSASRKYKESDGWITMDPTCKGCGFGEVPLKTWNTERKEYVYVG